MKKKEVSIYLFVLAIISILWLSNMESSVSLANQVAEGKQEVIQLTQEGFLPPPRRTTIQFPFADTVLFKYIASRVFRMPYYPAVYFINRNI